ncbi:Vegetative incompatibility protein HET-E-1, partial [Lachnellula subtilissima]
TPTPEAENPDNIIVGFNPQLILQLTVHRPRTSCFVLTVPVLGLPDIATATNISCALLAMDSKLHSSSSSSRSFLSSTRSWLPGGSEIQNPVPEAEDKIGPFGLNTLSVPPSNLANVDLIFVHGLGGGSRKTWTKSGDPSLYWPQEWLPNDEALADVRIHSFGYDSNWGKKSILGIHDFANALLNAILDCPSIPRDTKARPFLLVAASDVYTTMSVSNCSTSHTIIAKVPIVLVGHSMGGLVIKRAYLSAKARQEYASLAARIQGVIFLATPHRGSDVAQVLLKLLNLMGGQRPYVTDLNRDSETIRLINDEFPERCQDLLLYSFYETLPTSFAIRKSLVVERDLATMGHANERRAYLNADHRNVCKYVSRSDPNYLTVRNALASVLAIIRDRFASTSGKIGKERRRLLDSLLGVSDAPEDDFMSADSHRMDGSVEWLIRKENFQEWIHYANSPIYSVIAKPATGKTILSGRVIAHLRKLKRRCSFYFFRYNTKEKANVTSFLLCMAWQMANSDERIMSTCLQILEKDDLLKTDYRNIWRKLFLEGIFKIPFEHVHYWVVDALDECNDEAEIISLLMKSAEVSSVHILITSRNRFESRQKLGESKVTVLSEAILEQDSKSDITMYLHANMDALPSVGENDQQSIVGQILEKSRGCFLWVSIVVQELRNVHTSADKQRILDEVPTNMNELYARILDIMSKASYGKELAKAILTWTVCSNRPLKIPELHEALQLDLKVSIDGLESSIRSCCGQLVYIDANDQVQMTHLTARQFLLNGDTDSEFAINEKDGHRRILLTALKYLNSSMKGPRHRRSSNSMFREGSAFVNYASNSLSEHISYASSMDRDVLLSLAGFFKSPNVLHWIEYIAKHSDQQRLIEAGKALGTFLQESPDQISPTSDDVALLSSWATDLVRLVMQFGKNLEAYPASIFHLIPPFFPSATALRKQFGSSARSITVRGLRSQTWDDCLAVVSDVLVVKYSSSNKQLVKKIATLQHSEPVRLLVFGEVKNILVSGGSKFIRVWDLESMSLLHVFEAPQQCMALALDDEDRLLLGALKDHRLNYWDLDIGGPPEAVDWTRGLESMTIQLHRRPTNAAFGIDSGILAVIYKGQDILLWCLSTDELLALYSRESGITAESLGRPYGSSGVRCLVFGNASNAHLLACAYTDGELVLFDTSTGEAKKRIVAFAHILACSGDGCMLATADPAGTIQLFNLETLQLIYRMSSVEPGIQGLVFSRDGLRLLDIRGSRCRVWDLTDLVKENSQKQSGGNAAVPTVPKGVTSEPSENVNLITSIACDDNDGVFFVGKEDGSVHVYDIDSGLPAGEIFSHAHGVSIVFLHFEDQSHALISVDSSSRIMIHTLKRQNRSILATQVLFDYRAHVAVGQVVCQPGLQRILICSANCDMLWSISPDGNKLLATTYYENREPYQWTNHPNNLDQLIFITHHKAHIHHWQTLQRLTGDAGIDLDGKIIPKLSIQSITPCFNGTALATMFTEPNQPNSKSKLVLWSTSDFTPESTSAVPVPSYSALSEDVEVLIGNTSARSGQSERLVFLHGSQWVCTADIEAAKSNSFARHFFFPADWLSTRKDLGLSIKVTKSGDVLLVKDDEVAVVRRGLLASEFMENKQSKLTVLA